MVTKIELQQLNEKLSTENAALRAKISELEGQLVLERAQRAKSNVRVVTRAPYINPEVVAREAAMAAARAKAMATGQTVSA